MKFLAVGKMRGMCCDYGWGTRGNTRYETFVADSMEDAKQKVFDCERFDDLKDSNGDWHGESLTIYAISDEVDIDLDALQAKDAADRKAWRERKQRESDERELARLQEKLGK